MNVVPFPVLTMSSIVPRDWEPVLTLPLPHRPSLQLLEAARGQVLLYLDCVMHEMVDVDDLQVVRMEVIRATNRLIEIAAALPAAQEAHAERCMANADESDLLWLLKWAGQRDGGDVLVKRVLAELDARATPPEESHS